MAFTLSTMLTEFYARGFDFYNDAGPGVTRATRFIVDAMHEVDEMEDWPYLNAATSGAAPLTIADMRTLEDVVDLGNRNVLMPMDRRTITDAYTDLTTTGSPDYYYVTGGTTVNVYPVSTVTLTVRYWKFGPDLVAGGDAPLMPDRFRMAIVERACAKAYRDTDNPVMSANCLAESDRIVGLMVASLMLPQHQGPDFVVVTGASFDD